MIYLMPKSLQCLAVQSKIATKGFKHWTGPHLGLTSVQSRTEAHIKFWNINSNRIMRISFNANVHIGEKSHDALKSSKDG